MLRALEINNLTKTYANNFYALKGVNLSVTEGDFFALLGSNGAGKTTMIGIICGLLEKTAGEISVLGLNQSKNVAKVKGLIGLMPQEFNFNPFEPIEEILINQAGYHGIERSEARKNAEILLKRVELWDKRRDMAKSLSGGMKRRLMLARALIHQPKILILDEPSAGVDVEIRRSMWAFLKELNRDGMTIILTTHYLEEAESLCRNIAIVNQGKVVEQTSMKQLLTQISQQVLILESAEKLTDMPTDLDFSITKLDEYSLEVLVESGVSITQILQNLAQKGVEITHVKSAQNRLETLFLNLIEK
ncbi:ABC transporter ATP-binding protein [Bathymodiolus septemdierum thioautotrophic gill symbiont]|uniref:Antibiotic transport system ATP-binding protein n=1 Tax=endosymbiont of Bathymodiolus septemdierum str. Myojin knoll TaxID=1303921 RepID=A0A0P0UQD0_9GAMM|nr:ABC transporter ATP-binding protein [Bathymodiolus septemdierum thioautotrophic gill symbiont]BAS67194.1 antibiotic transport system ATP-binding protein [endosymbiont of Bathymodiolus septemdierum str. Myojin knoll]